MNPQKASKPQWWQSASFEQRLERLSVQAQFYCCVSLGSLLNLSQLFFFSDKQHWAFPAIHTFISFIRFSYQQVGIRETPTLLGYDKDEGCEYIAINHKGL